MICTGDSGWHIAVPPTPFHYMRACDLYNAPAAPGLASNLISGCSFKLHIAFVCNVHLINQSILHLFRYTINTHTYKHVRVESGQTRKNYARSAQILSGC